MILYLTFYLKGKVTFTRDNIHFKVPNTILGVIPLGANERAVNINHIVGCSSNFYMNLSSHIFGIIGLLITLNCKQTLGIKPSPVLVIIFSIFFICMNLNAFHTNASVSFDSENNYEISLLIIEKAKAEAICQNITMMTNARNCDTNVRLNMENQTIQQKEQMQEETKQVVDAINNLSSKG